MNSFTRYLARMRLFTARTYLIGIPAYRALLWELPRVIGWRTYNRFSSMLYAFIDQQQLADERTKQALHQFTENDGTYFYVIVVPRVLHLLIPAVQLVQHHVKVILIFNGISPVEKDTLRKEFPDTPVLCLWTFPKSSWPHGHLLSLLLRISKRDFGIIDHDFFLFDPTVLNQLTFKENEFAICATSWRNSLTGTEFPGTHFLYLRASLLRDVMERYEVGAQLYKRIPMNVKPVLKEIGLTMDSPPKDYQSFFDSFLMLSALAMHDGFKVRKLDITAGNWEHVGGTSIGLQVTKDPVHHYVSSRFLELLADTAITNEYRRKRLATPDKAQQLRKALDPKIVARVDMLIDRIASVL